MVLNPRAETPARPDVGARSVHVSVVSHGHSALIAGLLEDIDHCCNGIPLHVTVTLNVPEPLAFDPARFRIPVRLLHNSVRRGFSANHNTAFRLGQRDHPSEFFSIVNPDIRFSSDPFADLLACFADARVGVAAPLVLNAEGGVEDSARRFPTPLSPVLRVLGLRRGPEYSVEGDAASPDWVAGMFMLIPAEVFSCVGGFDERYFLYYEDVDLCARMRLAGYDVRLCPNAMVVHAARRQSHTDARYLRWHVASMTRFFCSQAFVSIARRNIVSRLTGRRRG